MLEKYRDNGAGNLHIFVDVKLAYKCSPTFTAHDNETNEHITGSLFVSARFATRTLNVLLRCERSSEVFLIWGWQMQFRPTSTKVFNMTLKWVLRQTTYYGVLRLQ